MMALADRRIDLEPLSPASAAKHQAILDAATAEFLEKGYGAAGMDGIAARAGVSKQTIYSHFGNKAALFENIVGAKCDALMDGGRVLDVEGGRPRHVLREFARRFLSAVLDRQNITLYRAIVAESGRFPELAAAFYRSGPRIAADRLASYLTGCAERGEIAVADPRRSAELFFAMLRSDLYMRCLLGLADEASEGEIDAVAAHAAEIFMAGHRTD